MNLFDLRSFILGYLVKYRCLGLLSLALLLLLYSFFNIEITTGVVVKVVLRLVNLKNLIECNLLVFLNLLLFFFFQGALNSWVLAATSLNSSWLLNKSPVNESGVLLDAKTCLVSISDLPPILALLVELGELSLPSLLYR